MGMGQQAQGVVTTMRTVAFTQEAFLMGSHQGGQGPPEGDGASVKVTHPSTAPHHLSDDRPLCTSFNHPVSHG